MFPIDPVSVRQLCNARLIEAEQARNRHQVVRIRASRWRRFARFAPITTLVDRSLHPSHHPTVERLQGAHELFGGLDEQQLARLAEHLTVVNVPGGRSLGRQADRATEFVTILDGRVGVTIDGVPHAVLDDGSHFGALALLDNPADPVHRASFDVMVPSLIAVATPREFRWILDEFPTVAQRIRAMSDVRRAYLAGLEQGKHGHQPTPPNTYPVHINP